MRKALLLPLLLFNMVWAEAQTQRSLDTAALTPVAHNDSATIMQPDSIILNVAANDIDSVGDSLCVTRVYGSTYFTKTNCSSVTFNPPANFTGTDSCWYVICNDSFPSFCDTAEVFVRVKPHYTPFMLENSRWIVVYSDGGCEIQYGATWTTITSVYYWTTTDTLVNGLSYKNIYTASSSLFRFCNGGEAGGGSPGWNNCYLYGYIRQDTASEKVYFLSVDSSNETLLYNFNLTIGDTVYSIPYQTSTIVTSIDSFVSNGSAYRMFNFNNSPSGMFSWIEGFGCTLGLFDQYVDMNFESGNDLLCFSSGNLGVYPANSTGLCGYTAVGFPEIKPAPSFSLHPNPAGNYVIVETNEAAFGQTLQLTDATGRELYKSQVLNHKSQIETSGLTGGIYFVKVSDNLGRFAVRKLIIE
jgi:hypothetical protein